MQASITVNGRKVALCEHGLLEGLAKLPTLVTVSGCDPSKIPLIDGRRLTCIEASKSVFVGSVAAINDYGYHELLAWPNGQFHPSRFAFCTEQASQKALLVREMIAAIKESGRDPRHLLLQGTTGCLPIRSPGLMLGWITEQIFNVLNAASRIVAQPKALIVTRSVKRSFGVYPDKQKTLALLRSNPSLCSKHDNGTINFGGSRYRPEFLIDSETVSTCSRLEHAQMLDLLSLLGKDIAYLREINGLGSYSDVAAEWQNHLVSLGLRINRMLPDLLRQWHLPRIRAASQTALQKSDSRYRQIFHSYKQYLSLRSYEADDSHVRVFLEAADKIYEAFCCQIISEALGLTPVGETLRDRHDGKSFVGDQADLYYDIKPPSHLLTSWRDSTSVADHDRPDILIHLKEEKVAILDCKFKNYFKDGNLSDDIREMQAYMHSYGIEAVGILTPYGREIDITDGRYRILVCPLRPVFNREKESLSSRVRALIRTLAN
jgi:hypothetical protein